jgi:dipeptidase E
MKLYLTSFAAMSIDKIDLTRYSTAAFIPTAADPYSDKWFVDADRTALVNKGVKVTNVDIKNKTASTLEKRLSNFDIIFVAGGNRFYLLEQMKLSGFDKILPTLFEKGIVYIGSCAGSSVTGPDISYISIQDDPEKTNFTDYSGLNLVNFQVIPHYHHGQYKALCRQIMRENPASNIIPLRDNQALLVEGRKLKIL